MISPYSNELINSRGKLINWFFYKETMEKNKKNKQKEMKSILIKKFKCY